MTVEHLELLLYSLEEAAAARNGHLPESEARVQLHDTLQAKIPQLSSLLSDVFSYWNKKRRKLAKPLLRKYWPQTASNDAHPHSVFRPREKERYKLRRNRRNDMDTYRKLDAVRADLSAARDLLGLIHTRERVKAEIIEAVVGSFGAAVAALTGTAVPAAATAAVRALDVGQQDQVVA